MTEPKTHTLDVPGAVLHYDIRSSRSADTQSADSANPVLLIIGSPMGARGFATLARHFPDRTVITYDPRGADRSPRTDDAAESTPDEHADDLHRLITALDVAGPVDLFASSGGAVNALALVAKHPEQIRTLVAHEPPAVRELPDRETAMATMMDIRDTYLRAGLGPAMAKFIALVSYEGLLPADFAGRPGPDPAMFGLPATDDGSRNDPLMQNMATGATYSPDVDALRAASTRVVIGIGADSGQQIAGRAGAAVAGRLGLPLVVFPGGHDGFSGGEYGGGGQPDEFAATLRQVLAASTHSRHSVYEAAGGRAGLLRLARAWHDRVMADEIVSHAFSHGFHPQHHERLAAYWSEALGGPADFSAGYGDEASVVRMHSGNGPHEDMDRRAIACFDQALQDADLATDGPLRQVLHDYFAWATTTAMSRYHHSAADVPAGLTIPHWSWDGLQP